MVFQKGMKRYVQPVKGKKMIGYDHVKAHADNFQSEIVDIADDVPENWVITPTYMTEKAVGADCFASEDTVLEPWQVTPVKTGIKAKFDGENEGLFAFVRSSIPGKKGILLANGVGVIEEDYYGNPTNDGEIGFMFLNITDKPVTIKRFERVGQLVITPILRFDNGDRAGNERGASGSTGN